jgi:hypothetical protein
METLSKLGALMVYYQCRNKHVQCLYNLGSMPLQTLHDVATICAQYTAKQHALHCRFCANAAIMILPEESLVSELTDGVQGADPVQLLPVTQGKLISYSSS